MNDIKFDFNDILIKAAPYTDIESRSEVNPFDENGMLPIFASPMDTVVDEESSKRFIDNKIYAIEPRKSKYTKCVSTDKFYWLSFSLAEFEKIYLEEADNFIPADIFDTDDKMYVLIDCANGHMKKLFDVVEKAKELYNDKIVLMVGNVANPETYKILSEKGADYQRIGIGNGCFTPDNQVMTDKGLKKIKDIEINDLVITHTGSLKPVIDKFEYERDEEIMVINGIECTKNHEFYVINKIDEEKINEENVHNFAFWKRADELDLNIHLLIELD